MNGSILDMALNIAIGAVSLAMLLCAWRLIRGPHVVDRILAVLLGIKWQTVLLFEAALIVAMLGFASTVALSRYLTRGDVIE